MTAFSKKALYRSMLASMKGRLGRKRRMKTKSLSAIANDGAESRACPEYIECICIPLYYVHATLLISDSLSGTNAQTLHIYEKSIFLTRLITQRVVPLLPPHRRHAHLPQPAGSQCRPCLPPRSTRPSPARAVLRSWAEPRLHP